MKGREEETANTTATKISSYSPTSSKKRFVLLIQVTLKYLAALHVGWSHSEVSPLFVCAGNYYFVLQTKYKGTAISTLALLCRHSAYVYAHHLTLTEAAKGGHKTWPSPPGLCQGRQIPQSDLHGHLHYKKPEEMPFGKTSATCRPTPVTLDSGAHSGEGSSFTTKEVFSCINVPHEGQTSSLT